MQMSSLNVSAHEQRVARASVLNIDLIGTPDHINTNVDITNCFGITLLNYSWLFSLFDILSLPPLNIFTIYISDYASYPICKFL